MKKQIRRRPINSDALSSLKEFDPIIARIFAARGCLSAVDLDYQLKNLLKPDLKGLNEACDLLVDALNQQIKILIVGDFDADGATSTALAVKCLNALGAKNIDYVVPNRFEFGYGLTPEIVEYCLPKSPDLIITVDNGISSIEGVQAAKENGIRVLVTDHHLPGRELPNADAIVNPNQKQCPFTSKAAAGVGVIFYVMLALRSRLRECAWFNAQRPEPNLAEFLDLVALGTVADVVPLDVNNRIFVDQGLKRMRAGKACWGIKALLEIAGRNPAQIQASDLGFAVGPRLNAAGRLDDMSLGIQCLLAKTESDANMLAKELDALNRDRRSIETGMQAEAQLALDKLNSELNGEFPAGVCLYQADWHQGVIGILASRVKDKLHRPVIVFANDDQGNLKGSGRSIPGIHLRDVLDEVATQNPGLLSKFGGHAMAAGLSLNKNDLEPFSNAFNKVVAEHAGEDGLQAFIETDGELDPSHFNMEFAEQLEALGPWGQAFPEPQFNGEFLIVNQRIVGSKHLKMVLALKQNPSHVIDAIAFGVDTKEWPNNEAKAINAVYKLSINEFRGQRNVQLMVDYLEAV